MEKRGISLNGKPPIWAWIGKPPHYRFLKDPKSVRLEIEIPRNLVLLSNYSAWHCILNNHYLTATDADMEPAFSIPCGFSRKEIEESWRKVFDNKFCCEAEYDPLCQATFPSIKLEYLRIVSTNCGYMMDGVEV